MNPRRLYRCRHDRWLAGVAGGMAEYFEIDPTVVRVLWILSAFLGGVTILVYIILAFVMPPEPMPMTGMGGYPGTPGSAGPGASGPATAAATGSTEAAPEGTPASTAAADGSTATADGAIPGWTPPEGQGATAGWQAADWSGHRHASAHSQGTGRAGFGLGVLLVVFGSIALLGAVIPAWTAIGLGPAFILALGVALIVLAARRPASES